MSPLRRLAIHTCYFTFNQILLFLILPTRADMPFSENSMIKGISFFFAFDLFQYGLHRFFHSTPLLWRFHQIHHSDNELDASTALRFHFVQLILGRMIEIKALTYFCPDPRIYSLYLCFFYLLSFFHHSQIQLPVTWEKAMCRVFVTPRWHRPHHAQTADIPRVAFGAVFSFWDRIFGTSPDWNRKIDCFGWEGQKPFSFSSLFWPNSMRST